MITCATAMVMSNGDDKVVIHTYLPKKFVLAVSPLLLLLCLALSTLGVAASSSLGRRIPAIANHPVASNTTSSRTRHYISLL